MKLIIALLIEGVDSMARPEQRIMKLGLTDGFRYIGFQPPLTNAEYSEMPLPVTKLAGIEHQWEPSSVQAHSDGTMDIGFMNTPFECGEPFEHYAARLAEHLGNCSLDPTIRVIGPGSIIGQSNSVPSGR